MKKTNLHGLLGVTFLALAGSFAATGSAHAVTYTDGDLLLGFRASAGQGSTLDYVIDIGPVSLYKNATSSFVLNTTSGAGSATGIGNIGLDLSSIYGANWATRSDLTWGVIGVTKTAAGGDTAHTEYASRAETTVGTLADAWLRRSLSSQSTTTTKVNTMNTDYASWTNTANSPTGVIENHTTDATGNYWASWMNGGSNFTGGVSFGFYDTSLEGNFGNGASGTALDLFRMATSSTAGLPGSYLGTFTTDTSGNITFNVANVPEPASLTMLGLGACLLGCVRRRRAALA